MTPFSGGSRGTHCSGRQNVGVPDQMVVGRQMRREEPIRVNPVSHENEHKLPVACPDSHLIVPFCGALSIGHISAEETREEYIDCKMDRGMFCAKVGIYFRNHFLTIVVHFDMQI